MIVNDFAEIRGRKLEYRSHVSGGELGYARPQTDTFGVLYPKDYDETKTYPLCVVFHSAGHTVYNIFTCLLSEGDHDVYHVPEDMFGLFPDCLAHAWDEGSTDWWWGGRNAQEPEPNGRSGVELKPVEKRVYATICWMRETFRIDPDRIYGVGNSMGGSGALGFTDAVSANRDKTMKALSDFLRPEFINRVDEIVYFNQLTEENFRGIAELMLTETKEAMADRGMSLTWNDTLIDYLVKKSYSATYGARNLRRTIQKDVEDAVAAKIIEKRSGEYKRIRLSSDGEKVKVELRKS